MWSVVSFVLRQVKILLVLTTYTADDFLSHDDYCTFEIELLVPIHSVYSITPTSDADMLLKRFLTKREALLTASIGVFVLIELWTSPRRFFDANNCNNDSSVIMKHQEYDPLWQFIRADSKEIRKWGCNRTETPTIFVHIGKYKVRAICFTTTVFIRLTNCTVQASLEAAVSVQESPPRLSITQR